MNFSIAPPIKQTSSSLVRACEGMSGDGKLTRQPSREASSPSDGLSPGSVVLKRSDTRIGYLATGCNSWCLVIAFLASFLVVNPDAMARDQDLQFWFPVQMVHPFGDDWTVSMQTEFRFQDNMSEFSELVLKPAVNYHINDHWALSAGYKFIDKHEKPNEHDIWQELHYNWTCHDWIGGHQVRLEERFLGGISGILPRLRLLSHVAHPIGDSDWYATGWAAARFNLGNKVNASGHGPVSGFEQSRIFAGLGTHIGGHTKLEFGYLYRYERERTSSGRNDHVIHLQLVFHPGGGLLRKLTHRDVYR